MHNKFVFARAFALFSVACLLSTSLPFPFLAGTAQAGAVYFEETWDFGGGDWTYLGFQAGVDPTVAHSGPSSLVVNSRVTGATVKAERDLSVTVPASEPGYVTSFFFRDDWPYMMSTSWFTTVFNNGDSVKLDLTHGNSHDKLRLYSTIGGFANASAPFHTYAADTWYKVEIKTDLVNDKVRVEVRDATTNALIASSASLRVSPNAGSIALVKFEGHYTGSDLIQEPPYAMNIDTFRVTRPDAPAPVGLLDHVRPLPVPGVVGLAGPGSP